MRNKPNPLKVKKSISKIILLFVIFILTLSIILLLLSLESNHDNSSRYKSYGSSKYSSQFHRHITIESIQDKIYNLGQYEVNLNAQRLLVLNISIQCTSEAFEFLQDNTIIVQNAVIETFSSYGSIAMANTEEGKRKIKQRLLNNINKGLHKPLVSEIYFNKFIIQ